MSEHPIEGLMKVAMNSIKEMSDVNTIVGDALEVGNNTTIIPISKVTVGFAAGGSEFNRETIDEYSKKDKDELIQYKLPFGGGSGAGVNIVPVAFIVIQNNTVKVLPVSHSSALDKLLDYMPDVVEKTNNLLNKCIENSKEDKKIERQENKKTKGKEQIVIKTPDNNEITKKENIEIDNELM